MEKIEFLLNDRLMLKKSCVNQAYAIEILS